MANAQTVTTIEAVHEGIIAAIRQRFPELLTVEAYRMDRKNLPVPACLVELTEMEAADNLSGRKTEDDCLTCGIGSKRNVKAFDLRQ